MAKRGRIPARKALATDKKNRNKNPKLSPYQKIKKRDRLANQPPVNLQHKRQYSVKSRDVMMYLQDRDSREQQKAQLRREAKAASKNKFKLAQAEAMVDVDKSVEFKKVMGRKRNRSQIVVESDDEDEDGEEQIEDESEDDSNYEEDEENETVSYDEGSGASELNDGDSDDDELISTDHDDEEAELEAGGYQDEDDSGEDEVLKDDDIVGENKYLQERQKRKLEAADRLIGVTSADEILSKKRRMNKGGKDDVITVSSLNAVMGSTRRLNADGTIQGEANGTDIVQLKLMKKAKKHERKVELKRQRNKERLLEMDRELQKLVSKTEIKKKRREGRMTPNEKYELELERMQKAKMLEVQKKRKQERLQERREAKAQWRKEKASERRLQSHPIDNGDAVGTKPTEVAQMLREGGKQFETMIDVVKFGDRVNAPPVFDTVPKGTNSLAALGKRLTSNAEGGASLSEKKRMAKLGLRPAVTEHVDEAAVKPKKHDPYEQMRNKVMENYRSHRMKERGADMKHRFPTL